MAGETKQYLDVAGLSRLNRDFDRVFINYTEVQDHAIEGSNLPISSNAVYVEIEDVKEEIKSQLQFGTAEYWEEHPEVVSAEDCVYFYTDAEKIGDFNIARMKVGDGHSFLKDLHFLDELYYQHINDNNIHVSAADRLNWNNKMRAYIPPETENLVLTIN